MPVIEIKSEKEYDAFLHRGDVVIIDAYVTWCGPCKLLARILEAIVARFDAAGTPVFVGRFDAENVPNLADRLGVDCYPTFLFHYKGDIVEFPRKGSTCTCKFEGVGSSTGNMVEFIIKALFSGAARKPVPKIHTKQGG